MFFCPTCGNILLLSQDVEIGYHFACKTCTYFCTIKQKIKKSKELTLKRVDEIRGGKAEWEAVPKTQAVCEACGHTEAYFKTRQMRSMDEPETITFRCVECANIWILDR